ncbi:hypothetical protein [Streptosporangium sp. NPDC087985]
MFLQVIGHRWVRSASRVDSLADLAVIRGIAILAAVTASAAGERY